MVRQIGTGPVTSRSSTGGDEIAEGTKPPSVDLDGFWVDEPSPTLDQVDLIVIEEVLVLLFPHLRDQLGLLCDQGGKVYGASEVGTPAKGL